MAAEELKVVRFAPAGKDQFHDTVISRVKAYFNESNISQYANTAMWVKTVIMLLLYFVPYLFMVSGFAAGRPWLFFSLWFVMAWGMSGIGTAVMHDAQHGAYSPKKWVNKYIGKILDIIGGYSLTWKIQHNQLHHTYTNIYGMDEDIDSIKWLRFSPRQPLQGYHRYQYLYIWFFYILMTLVWMTFKDYVQIINYRNKNLLAKHKVSFKQGLWRISMYKLFYYGYILVLPMLFSGMPWYYVVAGFLMMHFISGLFLSCVFQPSHVVETSVFAAPKESEGKSAMENSWAIHEVKNTTDFAPNNHFLTWFIGGLNYQIEHHLFTGICHVHYPKLAPIVRDVANEFGIPYRVEPTFRKALKEHVNMLKVLGRVEKP